MNLAKTVALSALSLYMSGCITQKSQSYELRNFERGLDAVVQVYSDRMEFSIGRWEGDSPANEMKMRRDVVVYGKRNSLDVSTDSLEVYARKLADDLSL